MKRLTAEVNGLICIAAVFALCFSLISCNGSDSSTSPKDDDDDASGSSAATYSITGTVKDESGNALSGITVMLTGQADGETVSTSQTTGSDGAYSFSGIANGTYGLLPLMDGYAFSPQTASVVVNGGNISGKNFIGGSSGSGGDTGGTYPVYGFVEDSGGAILENVLITLSGVGLSEARETYTDYDGEYLFIEIPNGVYTLTPSMTGYTFEPETLTITVAGDVAEVATTFVGAKSDSGGDSGGDTQSGGTYFPTTKDARWDWESETVNADGDVIYTDDWYVTMSISDMFDGETFVLMDISNSWNDPFVRYDSAADAVFFHWDDDSYVWFKRAANAEEYGGTFPYFKFGESAGATWDVFSTQYDEDTLITCTGEYIGKESVSTPAGSFDNCAKVKLTFTKDGLTYDWDTGGMVPETVVLVTEEWFAPGVGTVKVVGTRTIDNELSDIQTAVVTSYSIP